MTNRMRPLGLDGCVFVVALLACLAVCCRGADRPVAERQGHLVQATIYSADWCAPCRTYLIDVRREMPPDGWLVREAGANDAADSHILICKTYTTADRIRKLPTTVIRIGANEVDRIEGSVTPTALAERINLIRKR